MNESKKPPENLSMERIQFLRKATEQASAYLQGRIDAYLTVLRPALVPSRVLGQYIEHPGNRSVMGAEKIWTRIATSYRHVSAKLSGLPSDLDSPLAPIDSVVEVYPWEYVHTSSDKTHAITVTCPTRWVVSFRSGYSLSQFLQAARSPIGGSAAKQVQQFVVNAMVMGHTLRSLPKLEELFAALRLTLGEQPCPGVNGLVFSTISSVITSYRPSDDIVVSSTQLTGVPRFTELMDSKSIEDLEDPLKKDLQRLIA